MAINFSIPNVPSLTKTTPDGKNVIFVPDVNYLIKFSKGDLGIADAIHTSRILNNISSAKNPNEASLFLKAAGGKVDSPEKYLKNGKYIIPASAITLDKSKDQGGLKALEKSIIQSIFDSQKPYMDMIGQLSNVLITVEDVIARALALPIKSLKPSTNPRALGFKKSGKVTTKDEIAKLKSLIDSKNNVSGSNQSNNSSLPNNYHYEVESTVYSTGTFKEGVDYIYEYIDINNIEPIISGTGSEVDTIPNLPQTLIIAVYDNEGNMITDGHNLSWINKGKWFGNFDYLSDNDMDNINLYKSYYDDYTRDNLPSEMAENDKLDVINKIDTLNSNDDNKALKDQISSLKSDGYFPSVKYNNSNLLTTYNNTGAATGVPFRKAFAPKKININGVDTWIDPESDYDFKLIRCDVADKDNDNDINNINPFSSGIYGGDDNQNEDIAQIYRNKKVDTEPDEIFLNNFSRRMGVPDYYKSYYVLEGILTENNNQSFDALNGNSTNPSFSYYKKKAFLGVIKQFIKLIILIASKLTPSITAITTLASNPTGFVTTLMTANLGDNSGTKDIKFAFFSTEFTKKFGSLSLLDKKGKAGVINSSILKNFVVLNKDGSHKFLLGGSGYSYLKKIKIGNSVNGDMKFATFSSIYPVIPKARNLADSIDYSNLKFASYNNLLSDAQDLEDAGDYDKALSKYSEAQKLDPNNKTIADKIDALMKLIGSFGGNAMFSFILGMITLPLEIVIGVIEQIIKIISGFSSPTTLKDSIADLVSFKIFPGGLTPLDFFTPTSMLKLAKIEFNIALFMSWIAGILVSPLGSYDLNKIIKLPYVLKFPTYSAKEFKTLIFGFGSKINMLPMKLLTAILKIFEGIINAIVSFFWALMGLAGIYKQPKLKFTKGSNSDISAADLQALLNGTYTDVIDPNAAIDPNYNFIYNIQLPDGRTVRQLDTVELENFILQNTNFQYQNNF